MTADCISRERREGTLPLLFLTPLKAKDIVMAKGFAHGLRALTLCIAVIPIFTLCFLIGGVEWQIVLVSFGINFSSLCWALAAGILASSCTKPWLRAMIVGESLAFIFMIVFALVNALIIAAFLNDSITRSSWSELTYYFTRDTFMLLTNLNDTWDVLLSGSGQGARTGFFSGVIASGFLSLIALWVIVQISARNVRRNWQEKPPSVFQLWWEKKFCQPVIILSIFHRWMKFKLERNPIGWLEVRTWSGRLVIWGWFAVMVSIMTIAFWDGNLYQTKFHGIQSFMAWLLVLSIASSAAGSFQRERETGVLELLLVSPLRVQEIINGRLRGLWGQFLPAILLLLGVWIYWTNTFEEMYEGGHILIFGTTFATLPVIGLYCSLSSKNFIAALLRTFLWSVVLPMFAVPMLYSFMARHLWVGQFFIPALTAMVQILFALFFWLRLFHNLNKRKFSFERAMN